MPQFVDTEYRALSSPLYHYTSMEVFAAIMRTGKVRASHIAFMNDSSELAYGLSLLTTQLQNQMQCAESRERDVLAAVLAQVDTLPLPSTPVFAVCFSEEANLLSQWQAYTPHGRGVSIGFDHKSLTERAQRAGWHWTSCVYGMESQNAWMEAILTRIKREALKKGETMSAWEASTSALEEARSDFFACIGKVKHPAFAAEREWRLVSPPIDLADKRVQFRPGHSMLVPYVEFDLCDEKCRVPRLAETWVGPSANVNHAHAVINAIQRQVGVDGEITIQSSLVPLRQV